MVARTRAEVSLRKVRSAISNGSALLSDVDHRSTAMRRLRDLISDHAADLGGDLSTAEMALVRRAAMLQLQCEMMEARWSENNGEAGRRQLDDYQKCVGALRRTLESLGLHKGRRPRDVTPTVEAYIEKVSGARRVNGNTSRQ